MRNKGEKPMMKWMGFASFSILMLACSSGNGIVPEQPPCDMDAAVTDPVVDGGSGSDSAVADAGQDSAACVFHIDALNPASVLGGQAHTTLVVAKGCAFTGLVDVQVSVMSVPFEIVDDRTVVFLAARDALDPSFMLPYQAEVDFIKTPANQTQTFLTYTK